MRVQTENEIYEINGQKCVTLEQHEKELRKAQVDLDNQGFIAMNKYYLSIINRLKSACDTWKKKYQELETQVKKNYDSSNGK